MFRFHAVVKERLEGPLGLTTHQAAAADQEDDDADVEDVLPHRILFPRLQVPALDEGTFTEVHEELAS